MAGLSGALKVAQNTKGVWLVLLVDEENAEHVIGEHRTRPEALGDATAWRTRFAHFLRRIEAEPLEKKLMVHEIIDKLGTHIAEQAELSRKMMELVKQNLG